MGLTDRLFNFSLPLLREAGVRQYLLEVLQHNAPAVKIYRRQGFDITREFNCYTKDRDFRPLSSPVTGIEIRPVSVDCLTSAVDAFDFNPSWQNSLQSIYRHPEAFSCFGAFAGAEQVGFCATESAYGDLSLIAVKPDFRRKGIGRMLLDCMMECDKDASLRAINVDSSSPATNAFLKSCGFTLSCTQFEMLRPL